MQSDWDNDQSDNSQQCDADASQEYQGSDTEQACEPLPGNDDYASIDDYDYGDNTQDYDNGDVEGEYKKKRKLGLLYCNNNNYCVGDEYENSSDDYSNSYNDCAESNYTYEANDTYDECITDAPSGEIYQENCPQENFYDSNYSVEICQDEQDFSSNGYDDYSVNNSCGYDYNTSETSESYDSSYDDSCDDSSYNSYNSYDSGFSSVDSDDCGSGDYDDYGGDDGGFDDAD